MNLPDIVAALEAADELTAMRLVTAVRDGMPNAAGKWLLQAVEDYMEEQNDNAFSRME